MRYRSSLHNLLDPSDHSDGVWDRSFLPALPPQMRMPDSSPPPTPIVLPASGDLTINLIYDAAAMAAPASFRVGIQQAAALLSAAISDKITPNLQVDYSGTGGGAAAGPDLVNGWAARRSGPT